MGSLPKMDPNMEKEGNNVSEPWKNNFSHPRFFFKNYSIPT
jgi:hypothetical protein